MSDNHASEIGKLKSENLELSRLLTLARDWMERQWREDAHRIAKRRANKMTDVVRDDFLRENQEEIISTRIRNYFGELLLMNAPKDTVGHLVDSEIAYFNLQRSGTGDGLMVISSYTKILDSVIETAITSQFRKYAVKRGAVVLRDNDPLEKALHFVITKKYILSVGRLFGLLKMIRGNENLLNYANTFKDYLGKYRTVGDFLLSDEFYLPFETLVESDVFGSKRHSGKISFEETKSTRSLLLGDFHNQGSVFYRLLETQSTTY